MPHDAIDQSPSFAAEAPERVHDAASQPSIELKNEKDSFAHQSFFYTHGHRLHHHRGQGMGPGAAAAAAAASNGRTEE